MGRDAEGSWWARALAHVDPARRLRELPGADADPDTTLRLQVVVLYGGVTVLLTGGYAATHYAHGALDLTLLFSAFGVGIMVLLAILYAKGWVAAVAQLFVVVALTMTSLATYFTGGLRLTNVTPFFAIIVAAIFLLGWKGLPAALLSILVPLSFQLASWRGHAFPDQVAPEGRELDAFITWLSAAVLVLLFVASYEGARVLALKRRLAAERVRSEFLANISHELRTPLHAIMGMNEEILRVEAPAKVRRAVEASQTNAKLLLNLVDDLLDLASLERDRFVLHDGDFDPAATVEQLARVIRSRCEQKGLTLSLDIDPALPRWVQGDERRLQQVLLNLCSNAVKYTDEGSLRMLAEPWGGTPHSCGCRFVIEDTGVGIAEADHARIFEPFTQVDGSLTRAHEGAGLGLHIAQQIVVAMGGNIELDSEPGRGSTFRVVLPFAPAAKEAAQASESVPAESVPAESVPAEGEPAEGQKADGGRWPLSVLLVDDVKVNCELARSMLLEICTEVTVAVDGEEAVERWEATMPDLVLMDVQMPVMDGLEATRIIRQREAAAGKTSVPIIMLTGLSSDGHRAKCLEAGASDCLFKPFGFDELRQTIGRYTG